METCHWGDLARWDWACVIPQNSTDFWAMMTGVGTLALAFATVLVVLRSAGDRKAEDRRHEDGVRPVVVLNPIAGMANESWKNNFIQVSAELRENATEGAVVVYADMQNIGTGPATRVQVALRFLDMDGYTTQPRELRPLEADGIIPANLIFTVVLGNRFNLADYGQIPGRPWEILLLYEDVFGNQFTSVHHKAPGAWVTVERIARKRK